jgi:hypothetical protein
MEFIHRSRKQGRRTAGKLIGLSEKNTRSASLLQIATAEGGPCILSPASELTAGVGLVLFYLSLYLVSSQISEVR